MIDFLADYLIFQPFKPSLNRLQHNIVAIDPETYPLRDRIKYYLTLKIPDFPGSTSFQDLITIPSREKPPVVEGAVSRYEGAHFNFENILDGLLKRQKPTFRQNSMITLTELTSPYCLLETVDYDGVNVLDNLLLPKWVAKMGMTERDFDQWGERFFSTYQAEKRQFLTWQPNHKRIVEHQEEYLFFMLNFMPLPSILKLRVSAIFTDGTREAYTPLQLRSAQFGQVVTVPVGTHVIGANPTKTLQSYQVWLSNEYDHRLSEIRTYHLDHRKVAQERFIIFNNSFHTYDTLRLTGASTEAIKVTRTTAERERPLNAAPDFTEFYIVDRYADRELTISTGFFERDVAAQLRYLDELLMAEEWYLVTDRNHEPLELITTQLVDHDDIPDLVARQFQFRYVRQQNSYSRLPIAPPAPERPTYWKAEGLRYLLDAYGKRTGMVRPLKLVKCYVDDDTAVAPLTQKPNAAGDPDYVSEYLDTGIVVGSTPYPNTAISRPTTFVRSSATCPSGLEGGPATITVASGKYGGEQPGDADALAEAEYNSLNTQAYANTNGTCTLNANYTATVPTGHFQYRSNAPTKIGLHRLTPSAPWPGDQGNTPELQSVVGSYIYPVGSNALNFPVDGGAGFYFRVYGTNGTTYTLKVYRNGVLKKTLASTLGVSGYDNHYMFDDTGVGGGLYAPADGDKFYIQIS
ncbi:DUF5977 domain-containing protein [Runella sp. MFBS21]|uniref:DUF5977 domain-containing protein n=1 Tax=Runella sp. MFBS21 TaxID=3034018 RepID=UPI0023F6D3C5|nr:DUF5977 domain-containing protein [Runella sp. MFBS21]MDF7817925.1 DUF5977 domain-containing protein [Runella sp. MFBS21]